MEEEGASSPGSRVFLSDCPRSVLHAAACGTPDGTHSTPPPADSNGTQRAASQRIVLAPGGGFLSPVVSPQTAPPQPRLCPLRSSPDLSSRVKKEPSSNVSLLNVLCLALGVVIAPIICSSCILWSSLYLSVAKSLYKLIKLYIKLSCSRTVWFLSLSETPTNAGRIPYVRYHARLSICS